MVYINHSVVLTTILRHFFHKKHNSENMMHKMEDFKLKPYIIKFFLSLNVVPKVDGIVKL